MKQTHPVVRGTNTAVTEREIAGFEYVKDERSLDTIERTRKSCKLASDKNTYVCTLVSRRRATFQAAAAGRSPGPAILPGAGVA